MLIQRQAPVATVALGDEFVVCHMDATMYNCVGTVTKIGSKNFEVTTPGASGKFNFNIQTQTAAKGLNPGLWACPLVEAQNQKARYLDGWREMSNPKYPALFFGQGEI